MPEDKMKVVDGEEVDDSIDETDLTSEDVDEDDWEKDASSDSDATVAEVSDAEVEKERKEAGVNA